MRLKSPLAIVLLLLLLCACAPKGPPPPRLDVSISEINAARIGVMEQTYSLLLRVQNPNNFDIETDGLSFDIETNGQPFARGVSNQSVSMPRLSETMVKVNAVSDLSSIIGQLRGVPGMALSGFKYRLVGRFYAADQRFPFDYRGKIAGDQPE
jgi:LEA14-like dessication related protein